MHEPIIKGFSETGFIKDDKDFIRLRGEFERMLTDTMRYQGYVPVHDIRSQWSTWLVDNKYGFKITVYGVFAGKRKAKDYTFWTDGKMIRDG